MARIGVVQMQDDGPPGLLADWATAAGVTLDIRRLAHGDPLPEPGGADAVSVLGASASVNDLAAPRRDELRAWLSGMLADDVPVLGICFGGQLLASVLGAPITRLPSPEIGWTTVDTSDAALTTGPWFEWHEDAIMPAAPLRIVAHNARGVQAYRAGAGERHLGLQFHPEVTPAIVADWIAADDGDLAAAATSAPEIVQATEAQRAVAAPAAHALFEGWWQRVSALSRAPG